MTDQKPSVLFVCVHNAGRSQMAAGWLRELAGDRVEVRSAGSIPADQINSVAVEAMREVGIDRSKVYVTNAVKHFKFEQRGKRRLHQSPTAGEVKHYRWWLMRELDFVEPKLVVALGATAVLALTGKALPVTKVRGPHELGGHKGFITVHPSYLLRIPDPAARDAAYAEFIDDLGTVRALSGDTGR